LRMRWVGHVASMGERRGACRVLVGKQATWETQVIWEDNIKVDL